MIFFSNPRSEENFRGNFKRFEETISDDHQDIKRAPMRFGKREFLDEPEKFQILRSVRAPMRFGKRVPRRYGKRDLDVPSFDKNYYENIVGVDYF